MPLLSHVCPMFTGYVSHIRGHSFVCSISPTGGSARHSSQAITTSACYNLGQPLCIRQTPRCHHSADLEFVRMRDASPMAELPVSSFGFHLRVARGWPTSMYITPSSPVIPSFFTSQVVIGLFGLGYCVFVLQAYYLYLRLGQRTRDTSVPNVKARRALRPYHYPRHGSSS